MKLQYLLLTAALYFVNSAGALADGASTPASKEIGRLFASNQIDQALEKAQAQAEVLPNSAEAQYFLGAAYGQKASNASMFSALGLAKKAKAAFLRSIALDAKRLDSRFALMQFDLQAPSIAGGDKDEARKMAQEIAAIEAAAGHRAQAMLLSYEKNEAGALREYQAALAAKPADAASLSMVVGMLVTGGKAAAAKPYVDAALAAAPGDARVRYQAGKFSAVSGENLSVGLAHLDAILAMTEVPEGVPMAGAHWRRGQILEKLGRKPEAITAIEKAVAMESKLTDAKADLKRLKAL
jgi:tetratricopeptide (TPR) repeat protein